MVCEEGEGGWRRERESARETECEKERESERWEMGVRGREKWERQLRNGVQVPARVRQAKRVWPEAQEDVGRKTVDGRRSTVAGRGPVGKRRGC